MNQLSLLNTRPLARRSPLAISVLLHVVLISLSTLLHSEQPLGHSVYESHKRSVIVLNFRDLPYRAKKSGGSQGQTQMASSRTAGSGSRSTLHYQNHPAASSESAAVADPGTANKQPHRSFELAASPVRAVKQTVLQFDVPPDTLLKQEVPLPNVVFWTAQAPAPFRAKFVAPPVKIQPQKVAQNIMPAPDTQVPNREPAVSDLKISAMLVARAPLLVRPAATTSPVRVPGPQAVDQIPQLVLPESNPVNAASLIALTDSPTQPKGLVIVPPANQISNPGPSGSSGTSSNGGSADKGEGQGGQLRASGGQGSSVGSALSASLAAGAGVANTASNGAGSGAGSGDGSGSNGAGAGGNQVAGNTGSGSGLGSGSAAGSGQVQVRGSVRAPGLLRVLDPGRTEPG